MENAKRTSYMITITEAAKSWHARTYLNIIFQGLCKSRVNAHYM